MNLSTGIGASLGHRIVTPRAPRVAAEQPAQTQRNTAHDTMAPKGFERVSRTTGEKTTPGTQPWADQPAVKNNRHAEQPNGHLANRSDEDGLHKSMPRDRSAQPNQR